MPSNRRRVLQTLPMIAVGLTGCISELRNADNPFQSPTETQSADSTQDENPRPTGPEDVDYDPGGPRLLARWVGEATADVEVHPSDEPPVSDYDVVIGLFEDAVTKPSAGETDYGAVRGQGVDTGVSEETYEALSNALEEVETSEESIGRFFEHDDTIIQFLLFVDD